MKTNTPQTLLQCFIAMEQNKSVLLCEQKKDSTFADTQTINSIEASGMLTIYDENFGVVYDVEVGDILIINEL